MTTQDLLDQLQALETRLYAGEVEKKFIGNLEFTEQRSELGTLIGQLENAEEAAIAQRLDKLAPQFQAGIANLKGDLQTLQSVQKILATLASVLTLVGQVVKLVAK